MESGRSSSIERCVVDASALVEVLLRSDMGTTLERELEGAELAAPDLINAEVVHAFRRLVAAGEITPEGGRKAVSRLSDAPIERLTTTRLTSAMWDLRDRLTAYDAAYVVLARQLERPLVTADRRLARAPGLDVAIVCV